MYTVSSALLERHIIKTGFKIRVRDNVMDQSARIPEPDVVLCFHPRWNVVHRLGSIILKGNGFPGNVAKRRGINGFVHVVGV
jgi:hypothetical protein